MPSARDTGAARAPEPFWPRPPAKPPRTPKGGAGDTKLLATTEQYLATHALLNSWDTRQTELTEEQSGAAITSEYDAMRRITELTPVTAAGLQAKLQVAHLAMEALGDFELSHEERLARSVLADLMGRAAV